MGSFVYYSCFVIVVEKMGIVVRIWKDVFWIGYIIIRNINCWNNDKILYYY